MLAFRAAEELDIPALMSFRHYAIHIVIFMSRMSLNILKEMFCNLTFFFSKNKTILNKYSKSQNIKRNVI